MTGVKWVKLFSGVPAGKWGAAALTPCTETRTASRSINTVPYPPPRGHHSLHHSTSHHIKSREEGSLTERVRPRTFFSFIRLLEPPVRPLGDTRIIALRLNQWQALCAKICLWITNYVKQSSISETFASLNRGTCYMGNALPFQTYRLNTHFTKAKNTR